MFDYIFINVLIALKKINDDLIPRFLSVRSTEEKINLVNDFKDEYNYIQQYITLSNYITMRCEYNNLISYSLLNVLYL